MALVGTTASGKSALATAVARTLGDVEIVSVDSMCVYRSMDIATSKPSRAVRQEIRHPLLDLVDPDEEFTVADFQSAARASLSSIADRGHRALLVGGTGLYLRAVIDQLALPGRWPEIAALLELEAAADGGTAALYDRLAELDPRAASRTTPTNRRRIVRALEVTLGSGRPFSSFGPGLSRYPATAFCLVGIPYDPVVIDARIDERIDQWMREGLLDEVAALAARPGGLSRTARQALGYKELLAHVEDGAALEDCVAEAKRRTRSFARRQWAWFRRDPRIRWIDPGDDAAAVLGSAWDSAGE